MPRPYNPGEGIIHTDALKASTIGNVVKDPAQGVNGSLANYSGDNRNTGGKPSTADLAGLATYFNVGLDTVHRWFGMPTVNGVTEERNCVSLKDTGSRFCHMTDEDSRARIILAACISLAGGLQREPILTRGDKKGNPYLKQEFMSSIAQAVRYVMAFYHDDADPMVNNGWVQITIEPLASGQGWNVNILRFYPNQGENYHEDGLADVPDDEPDDDDNDSEE